MIKAHSRELWLGGLIAALASILAAIAPGYFRVENLTELFLANVPVLLIAIGMTLVILTGQIDISVGLVFAVCGIAAGMAAKSGAAMPIVVLTACLTGALLGSLNGVLVSYVRVPSIV